MSDDDTPSPADAVDLDPETDAQDTDTTADAHAAAEGVDAAETGDLGSPSTFKEMLLSTDPGTSLDDVESPWDPDRGGPARIMRAFQKMTDVDGLPAGLDLVIGVAETWVSFDVGDDSADTDSADSGGGFDGEIDDPAEAA